MSRDYKPAARPAAKGAHPMLAGVLIGILIGLGIALGVAYFLNSSPSPFLTIAKPSEPAAKDSAPQSSGKTEPTKAEAQPDTVKPRFDFYTILPGTEEPVSEQELKRAAQQPGAASGKEIYLLQVGAFQAETDADNMKAKLALIGLEAGIQTANVPEKGVMHRVRVGPFSNLEDLDRARANLAQNGIAYNLVKVRNAGAN